MEAKQVQNNDQYKFNKTSNQNQEDDSDEFSDNYSVVDQDSNTNDDFIGLQQTIFHQNKNEKKIQPINKISQNLEEEDDDDDDHLSNSETKTVNLDSRDQQQASLNESIKNLTDRLKKKIKDCQQWKGKKIVINYVKQLLTNFRFSYKYDQYHIKRSFRRKVFQKNQNEKQIPKRIEQMNVISEFEDDTSFPIYVNDDEKNSIQNVFNPVQIFLQYNHKQFSKIINEELYGQLQSIEDGIIKKTIQNNIIQLELKNDAFENLVKQLHKSQPEENVDDIKIHIILNNGQLKTQKALDQLFRLYFTIDYQDLLKQMYAFITFWAVQRKIYYGDQQLKYRFFEQYDLLIMIIHFLQLKDILPKLNEYYDTTKSKQQKYCIVEKGRLVIQSYQQDDDEGLLIIQQQEDVKIQEDVDYILIRNRDVLKKYELNYPKENELQKQVLESSKYQRFERNREKLIRDIPKENLLARIIFEFFEYYSQKIENFNYYIQINNKLLAKLSTEDNYYYIIQHPITNEKMNNYMDFEDQKVLKNEFDRAYQCFTQNNKELKISNLCQQLDKK